MIVTWILFILCITAVIGTLLYLVITAHPNDDEKKK